MAMSSRSRRHHPSDGAETQRNPRTSSYQFRVRAMSSVWSIGTRSVIRITASMGEALTSYSQGKHYKCPENIQRTAIWFCIAPPAAGATFDYKFQASADEGNGPANRMMVTQHLATGRGIAGSGAPRPMKMGTIASPWRYDASPRDALQLADLRCSAIQRDASWKPQYCGVVWLTPQ
jgi:hypothetical protein